MPKIRVHERALAHLSRGLYRSPASALRELVSNAWDANATVVTIDTNHPNFFQLSIEDNGDGFSRDDFERLMKGGIGNSAKRTEPKEQKFGRPTIGRLGIGMLGIAQICGSFTVTSRPARGDGFRARVKLYDMAKKKMDDPDSPLLKDAETALGDEKIQGKIAEVGTYDFEDIDASKLKRGTRILADDVTPTFTQAFQESLSLPGFKQVPLDWRPAVTKVLRNAASLQLLGDYWRLLWELSAACPLPYLADDAIPRGAVRDLNALLTSYNFSLIIDGRHLYKPVYLKGNLAGYTTKVIPRTTRVVYGNRLTFSGYICVQEGKQLKPDELRGIMVRIKNIGVGYYDPSMLDYRVNQGPRSRWVTGEIFVEEGLEDALNIDRDSFNRFHPEFRALQEAVHGVLEADVFPSVYRNLQERSDVRRSDVVRGRDQATRDVLKGEARHVKVVKKASGEGEAAPISGAHRGRDGVEITVPKTEDIPVPKSAQQLAQAILTIFELATLSPDKPAQRAKFSELLFDLLKRW